MLHTVNKSPFQSASLENCIRFMRPGDVMLLIEDGVLGAQAGTIKSPVLEEILQKHPVYALSADLQARAIHDLVPGIRITDYEGFVDLVVEHPAHAWL